jgi:hypothetical protein
MFSSAQNVATVKTTTWKVVLPFYLYAAVSFLVATILLFFSSDNFLVHYFQPQLLAITHIMSLGWGTMIILGASHQLVPVIIEGTLYSEALAYITFTLAAAGIVLLVYGFYTFNLSWPAKSGGILTLLSVLSYLINLGKSITKSKSENIHAIFVFTAAAWLFITILFGLMLVYNFTFPLMPGNSLHYLPLHAHLGIVGWFLLLVIGVASRLIPMFLISKYGNPRLLWYIFYLVNFALISFIFFFYIPALQSFIFISYLSLVTSVILFLLYCKQAYLQRIRKKVDEQMKVSLLSAGMMVVPLLLLVVIIFLLTSFSKENITAILAYGFLIFFGWLTAIILGMTFKTLPFIVWNKVYHTSSANGKTPTPKDLFNHTIFTVMSISYLVGIILFAGGIFSSIVFLLKTGAALLIATAFLYNWNVVKILCHKPVTK